MLADLDNPQESNHMIKVDIPALPDDFMGMVGGSVRYVELSSCHLIYRLVDCGLWRIE